MLKIIKPFTPTRQPIVGFFTPMYEIPFHCSLLCSTLEASLGGSCATCGLSYWSPFVDAVHFFVGYPSSQGKAIETRKPWLEEKYFVL